MVITMEGLVEPVDHVFPVVLPDVKVTFPPGHNVMDEAVMEAVKLLASKMKDPVCLQALRLLAGLLGLL